MPSQNAAIKPKSRQPQLVRAAKPLIILDS
jgi:hypothetical protein